LTWKDKEKKFQWPQNQREKKFGGFGFKRHFGTEKKKTKDMTKGQ